MGAGAPLSECNMILCTVSKPRTWDVTEYEQIKEFFTLTFNLILESRRKVNN